MILLLGIGNVGSQYEITRHNVGFMAIDKIKEVLYNDIPFVKKFNSEVCTCSIVNNLERYKITLMKPRTFVNLSGVAALSWKSFYKEDIRNIFVIYDDISLELGKIRIVNGGGSGGHNGIKSITSCIGSDYFRIKIGIKNTVLPLQMDMRNFVLGKFSDDEFTVINKSISRLALSLPLLIERTNDSFSKISNPESFIYT